MTVRPWAGLRSVGTLAPVVLVALACTGGPSLEGVVLDDPCRAVRGGAPPFQAAAASRGATRFERDCAQCHSMSTTRDALPGPPLGGVLSRRIGQEASFRFSRALRERQDTWTLEALDRYIEDPAWFIPETRMSYAGLNDPAARLDLLAFLACPDAAAREAPAAPVPDARLADVHPGANATFESDDLDVARFADLFESESREVYARRDAIVTAIGLEPGDAVADVGSGTGMFLPSLQGAVGESGRVYAVEIAPKFLAHLEERVEREGLDRVVVVAASERSSELPSGSIDAALVCDTYHHFEYPQQTLESLRDALRPGGQLVVVDFERIPGKTRDWLLEHMRADKQTFTREIRDAGFEFVEEVPVEGLEENYVLRFRRP